ncbi:MAG: ArsR/SmtB family transcription factor [Phycisphaerales bacterium]
MSKYRTHEADDAALAATLKALGHPHRLRLFQRLCGACFSDSGCCPPDRIGATIGAVAADLGVSPGTVSHHCKVLQAAGLMICERRGQQWACCVDARRVRALSAFFAGVLASGTTATGTTRGAACAPGCSTPRTGRGTASAKRASQPRTKPRSKP